MNVLLVSQCDKRALTETRRILDQFAERRGDRTWQTPITHDGLDTLRRLLRKTARKNTAVACHWIRGLDHSELLWIVGNPLHFNVQGAVPTNTTKRDVLRKADENDWHSREDIHLLTALAALLHDLGKACAAFQARLRGALTGRNQYRHEWVSLRLFEAFVGTDDDATWLTRLAAPTLMDDESWRKRLIRDGMDRDSPPPFKSLGNAPLAQAIGWLVLTHHRVPERPWESNGERPAFTVAGLKDILSQIEANWNETPSSNSPAVIAPYWDFPHGLPVTTAHWRQQATRIAQRLLKLCARPDRIRPFSWLGNPYVMHLSRLCLMLADHHYSSLTDISLRVSVPVGYPLYANTAGSGGLFNQTLDEHLIGVAQHSREATHALPRFDEQLPRLGKHKKLRQRAQHERFRWQDKAADMAATMRDRSTRHGAFIVNMASTGCGKTLANARIMHALADPAKGMRCAFAMGLRILTLQTGRAFRDLLQLGDDELAIRVGGSASRALFEHYEALAEQSGSASRQALLDEDSHVDFIEGNHDAHPLLRRVMHDPQVRALLAAPLLVCTIDQLTPATESQRGGRQIAPMLRLMSGDLVLDEPDDFDINDLPALARLVHWAGLLGSRVLLSSATLPPALLQGLFEAYRAGRTHFQNNRGERPGTAASPPEICCAWVDEFSQSQADCATPDDFETAHDAFARQRYSALSQQAAKEARRRCELIELPLEGQRDETTLHTEFARLVLASASELHTRHHSVDPRSGKRVSFGLIRMANIEPLFEVALALFQHEAPSGSRVHLCVYHSQFPMLIRSAIEYRLDTALNRSDPEAVFALSDIRHRVDANPERDQMFIVLGSPVTEVGRDHDYDWAIVEPSSMRSLIQLAGRIRRHRDGACSVPNLRVFNTNLRHCRKPDESAFCMPGFESREFPLDEHHLKHLLRAVECDVIDARPRIVAVPADHFQPHSRMVDLEHARMRDTMLPGLAAAARRGPPNPRAVNKPIANATLWWSLPPADALLTSALPRQQPFRQDIIKRVDLLLRVLEDDSDDFELTQLMEQKFGRGDLYASVEYLLDRLSDNKVQGPGIQPWGETDYMDALRTLAEARDMSLPDCARRFGTVTLPEHSAGWRFHPALGFAKRR